MSSPRADQATVALGRALSARGPSWTQHTGARFLLDDDGCPAVGTRTATSSRRRDRFAQTATFSRQDGRFVVRDVGSLNGTYVNRERIDEDGSHHG